MSVNSSNELRINYGGQAVLEGVMMRGRRTVAIAVRHPAGHIVLKSEPLNPKRLSQRLRGVPFVRGAVSLWEMLVIGMKALNFSGNVMLDEGSEGAAEDSPGAMGVSLAMGVIGGIALFFVLPLILTSFTDEIVESDVVSNVVEGGIRMGVFIAYMALIGLLPDIKRVWMYHGAEHQTINAIEAGETLTVDNVQRQSLQHPRCGTSFMVTLVAISILVFSLMGRPSMELRVISRIVLLPLIAGIGYEFIMITARNRGNLVPRILSAPGMWFQRLTTREPDSLQIEVAIAAMDKVLELEEELSDLRPPKMAVIDDRAT